MTDADAIHEMMNMWNRLAAVVKREYPDLTYEDRYRLTRAAMNRSLGLGGRSGPRLSDNKT